MVDGGYLDNSGVVTAHAIIREIQASQSAENPQNIKITLIILTDEYSPQSNAVASDLFAPFNVLLNTRAERGGIAIKRAEKQSGVDIWKVVLKGRYGYPLPLGWHLSQMSRLIIWGQNNVDVATLLH